MFGPSSAFLKYVFRFAPGVGNRKSEQTTVAKVDARPVQFAVTRSTGDKLFLDLMNNRRKLTEEEIEAHTFKTGLGMRRLLDNYASSLLRRVKAKVAAQGDIEFTSHPPWRLSAAEFKRRATDAFRIHPEPNKARQSFINRMRMNNRGFIRELAEPHRNRGTNMGGSCERANLLAQN